MMTRTGLTLTILGALAFVVGMALWAWQTLSPTNQEQKPARFSFADILNGSNSSASTITPSETPYSVSEAMPVTPENMAPPIKLTYGELLSHNPTRPTQGNATLYRLGTGEYLLRIEHFEVAKSPSLRLFLTGAEAALSSDVVLRDFIDIGDIKAQRGNHNYLIPADVDLSEYHGLVVYSPLFRDIYATTAMKRVAPSN